MPGTRWTKQEKQALELAWGASEPVETIARKLGRTPAAVMFQGYRMGLRAPLEAYLTMNEAARYSGWSITALERAIRGLGMVPRRRPAVTVYQGERKSRNGATKGRPWGFTVEQVDRMVAYLDEHPLPSSVLGPGGAWPACRRCGKSGVPHAGHGLCCPCDRRRRRAEGLIHAGQWTGRTCRRCGGSYDVPEERRKGAPPWFCDGCRPGGNR